MNAKEADAIAYEIIGLASGLLGGVWGYIDMSSTIKHLSNVSPKILDNLDLIATGPERQVLIDCGVDLTIEEADPPPDAASIEARWSG